MAEEGNKQRQVERTSEEDEGMRTTDSVMEISSAETLESVATTSVWNRFDWFRRSKSKTSSERPVSVRSELALSNKSTIDTKTRTITRTSNSSFERKKKHRDSSLMGVVPAKTKGQQSLQLKAQAVGNLEAERYYHGLMPREDIETMLTKDGDYLVRKTDVNSAKRIAISVRYEGKARHVLLRRMDKGWWRLGQHSFSNIPELIEYFRSRKIPVTPDGSVLKTPIPRQKWQLHHEHVRMGDKLGSGAFGDVFRGVLALVDQPPVDVAIKTLRGRGASSKSERKEFMAEAAIMRRLCHPNIVRVLGVIAQEDPLMILMELMPKGSLLSHLRTQGKHCPDKEYIRYCMEAACGMKYLESKNFLHRDVAARNCLLGPKNEVKITDFGLSTQKGSGAEAGAKMAIKWLAPETLQQTQFSTKTDVWSFGVLMWEVLSDGAEPYPSLNNSQVRTKLLNEQYRMEPPDRTPSQVKPLFAQCWQQEPQIRPTFKQLYKQLKRAHAALK